MSNSLVQSIKELLKETFEGPAENGSWYVESKPNSGIFGTLATLSADKASIPVQGTTVAAHTDHTRYYLWGMNTIIRTGEQPKFDWSESWKITSVDESTWEKYQGELQHEYNTLLEKIDTLNNDDGEILEEALGSIAHSAYHLGAIKQMVKHINGSL
ncbi:hypothetical protein [Alkalihalobacillus sp. AL-G]|uniref:hypothetical protein n=1 Tax=Alkalihalobacillus sp. AL-G TaxID=2926399 RepID=UPI00272C5C46|nr:hypothetical protein [Alkalihalobacillus sp. AL-G]WLD93774.1 hypothetical protein MOJ78_02325 [Alkalihalobacillus sp. AL-G]